MWTLQKNLSCEEKVTPGSSIAHPGDIPQQHHTQPILGTGRGTSDPQAFPCLSCLSSPSWHLEYKTPGKARLDSRMLKNCL